MRSSFPYRDDASLERRREALRSPAGPGRGRLDQIPEPIDLVDVFRRPEHTPEVARAASPSAPSTSLSGSGSDLLGDLCAGPPGRVGRVGRVLDSAPLEVAVARSRACPDRRVDAGAYRAPQRTWSTWLTASPAPARYSSTVSSRSARYSRLPPVRSR